MQTAGLHTVNLLETLSMPSCAKPHLPAASLALAFAACLTGGAAHAAPFNHQGTWQQARCEIVDTRAFAEPRCHEKMTIVLRQKSYEYVEENVLTEARFTRDDDKLLVATTNENAMIPRAFTILGPDLMESRHGDVRYGTMKIHWVRAGKTVRLPEAAAVAKPASQSEKATPPARPLMPSGLTHNLLLGSWTMQRCIVGTVEGNDQTIADRLCKRIESSAWQHIQFADNAMRSLNMPSVNLPVEGYRQNRSYAYGKNQFLRVDGAGHREFGGKIFYIRHGNELEITMTPDPDYPLFGETTLGLISVLYARDADDPLFPLLVDTAGDLLLSGAGWGSQEGCSFDGNFGKLVETLAVSTGTDWHAGQPALPEGLSADKPIVKNRGEFTEIRLPLHDATWRRLPVRRVILARGNQTGVNFHQIVFDAPLTQVASTFADWGFSKDRLQLRSDGDFTQSAGLKESNGETVLTCNYSS